MRLYLDIAGVLLDNNLDTYANGSIELIGDVVNEFDCSWHLVILAQCKK